MCLQYKYFENTAGKEVTSNFSFSQSIFYPSGEICAIFIKLQFVVCKFFEFRRI